MHIQNIMEDIIYEQVNKLFDDAKEKKKKWLICSCLQCRLDTMCYVLNRVKPRYIKSGKGYAHFLSIDFNERSQIDADISALVIEGMHRVLETQRPHDHGNNVKEYPSALFNFPAISGKVLNGSNFNSMSGVEVSLKLDNKICPQSNILWDNPYTISDKTPGTYIFCPKSVEAKKVGETREFRFHVTGKKDGFEIANISFEIELIAEGKEANPLETSTPFEAQNLFLFTESG